MRRLQWQDEQAGRKLKFKAQRRPVGRPGSAEFQQRLLNQAVQTYGGLAAARRYVQTLALSKHVIGEAVDVGGVGADEWLMAYGARFGLCRIYANELWHFELATDATGGCPALLPHAAG